MLLWAVGVCCLVGVGCGPTFDDMVINEESGEQVRLVLIDRIVNNTDLNEEQKRQQLRDAGVTDPDLIDLLIPVCPDSWGLFRLDPPFHRG